MATPILNWKDYSPDLNPIENLWVNRKKNKVKLFPAWRERIQTQSDVISKLGE